MKETIFITVKNQFDDVHCYPNAPEQVSFLQSLHRHTFMIETTIEVFHEDRELEFYMVKDYIDSFIPAMKQLCQNKSCENIARYVANQVIKTYCNDIQREIIVSVSEDDRNKATLKIEKELK